MKLTKITPASTGILLPLEPGFTGKIEMFRNGDMVTLNVENLQSSTDSVGSAKVAALPSQHRPLGRVVGYVTMATSLPDVYRVWVENLNITILGGLTTITTWKAGTPIRGQVMFQTIQPRP